MIPKMSKITDMKSIQDMSKMGMKLNDGVMRIQQIALKYLDKRRDLLTRAFNRKLNCRIVDHYELLASQIDVELYLDSSRRAIASLGKHSRIVNLTGLDLSWNCPFYLTPLSGLINFEELSLRGLRVLDLTTLPTLLQL